MREPITLVWGAAESADDTHGDISTDLSGVLVAIVSQDASPSDPSLKWRWCIDDWSWDADGEWPPPEPTTLAYGYVASQQAGRTTVLSWVRENIGTCDSHDGKHTFRNDPDPCIGWWGYSTQQEGEQ